MSQYNKISDISKTLEQGILQVFEGQNYRTYLNHSRVHSPMLAS